MVTETDSGINLSEKVRYEDVLQLIEEDKS